MAGGKIKPLFSVTEDLGVTAVRSIAARDLGWIAREQPTSDYGIDVHLEIVTAEGDPTGRLIGVQIKSGASFFKQAGGRHSVRFYLDERHLNYWLGHSLPVIVVLHLEEESLTLWQWASSETVKSTGKGGWYLDIPRSQIFGKDAKHLLEDQTPRGGPSALRRRFAMDVELMRAFIDKVAFAKIEVWVNKTWSIRAVEFHFDTYSKQEPDLAFGVVATTSDVGRVLHHFCPWLDVVNYLSVEDHCGEVEDHVVEVRLSAAAERFLDLEEFFVDPPDAPELYPPRPDDNGPWYNHDDGWYDESSDDYGEEDDGVECSDDPPTKGKAEDLPF